MQKNIVLIVVRRVNEFERLCFIFLCEGVCERNASAPHGAFLVCRVGFFSFVFLFDLTQIIDNGNFGEVALMEIPQCT